MKKFLKALAALAAFALIGTSFIACSDDDDEKDSAVVFEGTSTDDGDTIFETITFKDGNVTLHIKSSTVESGISMSMDLDAFKGTYTGDPSKDGDVKIKITHMADTGSEEALEVIGQRIVAAAFAGSTSVKFTNTDFPLEVLSASEQVEDTISIIGGKFTEDGTVYTRK